MKNTDHKGISAAENLHQKAEDLLNHSASNSVGKTGQPANSPIHIFILDKQPCRKGTEGEPTNGLGLIICKDFIEKQGGKIWVESETGKGTIFTFTSPNSISGKL